MGSILSLAALRLTPAAPATRSVAASNAVSKGEANIPQAW
jgi:hypothetical protein